MYERNLWLGCLLVTAVVLTTASPVPGATAPPSGSAAAGETAADPNPTAPQRPVTFQAAGMDPAPAAGKGRLSISLDGNRRWCTAPDDRVLRPMQAGAIRGRNRLAEVFTFGYQFTIAAIRRGQPEVPIMLYESPVVRTATWRLASKLPPASRNESPGPAVGGEMGAARPSTGNSPGSLVPYWQEPYRCVTVADRFEFDVDPGIYDVYMAFDLLLKDGAWVHRSSGYLTDVPVERNRHTVLDGKIQSTSSQSREVDFVKVALVPLDSPPPPAGP